MGNCTVYSEGAGRFWTCGGTSALLAEVVYIIPPVSCTAARVPKRDYFSSALYCVVSTAISHGFTGCCVVVLR